MVAGLGVPIFRVFTVCIKMYVEAPHKNYLTQADLTRAVIRQHSLPG